MLIIRGNTFEHRDTLQDLGARWDMNARQWEIRRSLSDAAKARLRALVGVTVTDTEEDPAAPGSAPQDEPQRQGKTVLIGDDFTWLDKFVNPNPLVYFGFSSLGELAKYVGKVGTSTREERDDFYGTRTMREALDLVKDGWSEGVENAERVSQLVSSTKAQAPRNVKAISGGSVNVGRMLAGNPKHMRRRAPQPKAKVVTIFTDLAGCAQVRPETFIARAAAVGAVVNVLEDHGYSCEVVSVSNVTSDTLEDGKVTAYYLVFTVKAAGERLNLSDMAFSLGHPAAFRRFAFTCCLSRPELKHIHSNQGYSSRSLDKVGKNEIYLPLQNDNLKGSTVEQKAIEFLRTVNMKGLTFSQDR